VTLLDPRYLPTDSSSTVRSQPGPWRSHITADLSSSPVPPWRSLIFIFHRVQNLLDDAVPDLPLIGPLSSLSALRTEYEGGSRSFVNQIDFLISQGYVSVRRARGDGDCFYRCEHSRAHQGSTVTIALYFSLITGPFSHRSSGVRVH
jgi:hypothetical protein